MTASRGEAKRPSERGSRFHPLPEWASPSTRFVHAGRLPERNAGAIAPPLYLSSTFRYPPEFSEASEHGESYIYTREGNPTIEGAAEAVRELEGAGAARLFASGMGAITASVLSAVRAGDEVVAPEGLYGGTLAMLRSYLPRFGVRLRLLDDTAAASPEAALTKESRLVVLETPTNPLLRVHDLRRWAEAAGAADAALLVDNTFASPINQRPLAHGADLVVESATKYLGGHSDLLAGVVAGPADRIGALDPKHHLGAAADPFVAFLLHRSLRTLELRMAQHNRNATDVLAAVAGHSAVKRCHYPGLHSPEEEAVAKRQMSGRGGVLSLTLRGGAPAAERFLRALRIVQVASSFGGVESLVSVPQATSHRGLSDAELRSRGIVPGQVRLSLGIEASQDLIHDITDALAAAGRGPSPAL